MTAPHTDLDRSDQIAPALATLVQAGRDALTRGDLASAKESFIAVTVRFPREAVGHNNLGGFYMGLGEHAAAAASFARALALAPDSLGIRFNLAVAQFKLGAYETAAAGFAALAAATPEDPEVWNNLGAARFLAGDHAQAATDFLAALELNPNYPDALLNLCDVEQAAGNSDAALQLCEAYLAHHRDLRVLRRLLELRDARARTQPQAQKATG